MLCCCYDNRFLGIWEIQCIHRNSFSGIAILIRNRSPAACKDWQLVLTLHAFRFPLISLAAVSSPVPPYPCRELVFCSLLSPVRARFLMRILSFSLRSAVWVHRGNNSRATEIAFHNICALDYWLMRFLRTLSYFSFPSLLWPVGVVIAQRSSIPFSDLASFLPVVSVRGISHTNENNVARWVPLCSMLRKFHSVWALMLCNKWQLRWKVVVAEARKQSVAAKCSHYSSMLFYSVISLRVNNVVAMHYFAF